MKRLKNKYIFKSVILLTCITYLVGISNPPLKVLATTLNTEETILDHEIIEYTLNLENESTNLNIVLENEGSINTIIVTDENNEQSVAIVNSENNSIIVDGVEIDLIESYVEDSSPGLMSVQSTSGVIKTSFNITPKSVANAVATIAAIASLAATVASSGLTIAVFKDGVKKLAENIGIAALIPSKPSLNGYYQFQQQRRTYQGKYQHRNINRVMKMRVNTKAYKTYNYGNSVWFYGSKPF